MDTIPTHTNVTPKTKKTLEIKDWITGFDDEAIKEIYFKDLGSKDQSGLSTMSIADREGIKRVVASFEGNDNPEAIVDLVYGLPVVDVNFVVEEVKKILRPLDSETENTSSKTSSTTEEASEPLVQSGQNTQNS